MARLVKVLFIEDEALLRSLFEDSLTAYSDEYADKYQFELDTRKDYLTAMEYLEKMPAPDLIVLDLRLPVGKADMVQELPEPERGFDLLRKIKSEQKFKNCPVLVFTNLGDRETEQKAKQLGADKFMIKAKVLPKQLLDAIVELLEKK